jgi:hypothetical protein
MGGKMVVQLSDGGVVGAVGTRMGRAGPEEEVGRRRKAKRRTTTKRRKTP